MTLRTWFGFSCTAAAVTQAPSPTVPKTQGVTAVLRAAPITTLEPAPALSVNLVRFKKSSTLLFKVIWFMLWVAIVTIMGLNKNNQGSSADRLLFVKLRLSHIFKVLMRATPVQKCAVNVTLGNLQQETGPSPVMPVVLVPSLTHQVRTAPGEVIIRIRSLSRVDE